LSQRIRLRYSGFTYFASKAFSIFTGFIFVIAVTRNISSHDFGVWQNIGDMVSYFVILSGVIPAWVTRYVARDQENAATTGLLTNFAMSIPFLLVWLFFAPEFSKIADSSSLYYTVAFLMILGSYLKPALEGIAQAKKPHLLGWDVAIHESTMVSLGIVLVMILKFGLLGALMAVITSNFIDVVFYILTLRGILARRVNWGYLRNWFRASTVSIYGMVGDRLAASNTILLIIYSGATARAYFGAAYTVAVVISYVSTVAVGLYPKLLAGGTGKDVETVLKSMYMFAIPMVFGTIVLARPLLAILNPVYDVATSVLYLMAISFLPWCLSTTLDTIIMGTERIDQTSFKMKDLIKSRLFLPASLSYLNSVITLPLIYFVLAYLKPTPLDSALYLVAIGYVGTLTLLSIKYVLCKRYIRFRLPVTDFVKYTIASIIMVFVLLQLPVPARISTIIPIVVFGAAIYFAILLVIDSEARNLLRNIVSELKKTKNMPPLLKKLIKKSQV
jgi:O-antigen/teichoic acid export membrane protein